MQATFTEALSSPRIASIAQKISFTLAALLPFLVPLTPYQNIELQGILLILSGVFAGLSLIGVDVKLSLSKYQWLCVGVFVASLVMSFLISPHKGYGFWGAPHVRLGMAGLLACLAIGLSAQQLSDRQLLRTGYAVVLTSSLLSVPFSLMRHHSLHRLGGVFSQADLMAVWLGCGLLLGMPLLMSAKRRQQKGLILSQLLLGGLLLLTQTRAAIGLTALLLLVWCLQHQRRWLIGCGFIVLLGLLAVTLLMPGRLTNTHYAGESVSYRFHLQHFAVTQSLERPVLGYGPGNLADALDCRKITANDLLKSCHDGYFFNSSHDIFLDRALMIGWLGGVAFAGLVATSLARGIKQHQNTLAYVVLLISLYYLTNVTSLIIELLLWVLILRPTRQPDQTILGAKKANGAK